jgi:hypothetical protein
MSFAVKLDDEIQLPTVEVGDENADGRLPTELEATKFAVAKDFPESLFRRGRFGSELPRPGPCLSGHW